MGVCGSRNASTRSNSSNARDLSRWKADDGGAGAHEAEAPHDVASVQVEVGNSSSSDLIINSITYHAALGDTNCLIACEDGTIKRMNWRTNKTLRSWQVHSRAANRIVMGPSGQFVYSCSRDTTIGRQSISHESLDAVAFRGHSLNVSTIAINDTESMLCSGGRDTATIVWDVETQKQVAKNITPQNVITCSKWIPTTASLVAQGSEDLTVKLWDTRTSLRTPSQLIQGYVYFPLCLDISPDGNYILTSSKGFNGVGCEGRVWDRRTGTQIVQYDGHQQDTTSCCFFPSVFNGEAIPISATASKDGTIKIWDAAAHPVLRCDAHEPTGRMFTSMAAVNDQTILAATFAGRVHAFVYNPELHELAYQEPHS